MVMAMASWTHVRLLITEPRDFGVYGAGRREINKLENLNIRQSTFIQHAYRDTLPVTNGSLREPLSTENTVPTSGAAVTQVDPFFCLPAI